MWYKKISHSIKINIVIIIPFVSKLYRVHSQVGAAHEAPFNFTLWFKHKTTEWRCKSVAYHALHIVLKYVYTLVCVMNVEVLCTLCQYLPKI